MIGAVAYSFGYVTVFYVGNKKISFLKFLNKCVYSVINVDILFFVSICSQ